MSCDFFFLNFLFDSTSLSTNSITAKGALSPYLKPAFTILVYPPDLFSYLFDKVFYILQLKPLLLENNTLDWGVFYGSFLGLFLLASSLAAISLWASTLVESAFSAFLIAVFIGVFHFYGWNQIADLFTNYDLYSLFKSIGLQYHYGELNKGNIRLSNVIYFILQPLFFLFWTRLNIKNKCQ